MDSTEAVGIGEVPGGGRGAVAESTVVASPGVCSALLFCIFCIGSTVL